MALRLTSTKRDEIHYLRDEEWYTRRQIEQIMWVDHSVLIREYHRNQKRWWSYDPKYAQIRTKQRTYYKKKQCQKIRMNNALEDYVYAKLEIWWTAEAVAGRRSKHDNKLFNSTLTISWASIRRYIDSRYGSYIKFHLIEINRLNTYKKRAKRGKREGGKISNRVFIDLRPRYISHPITIWHYECDFIVSTKWDKCVLMTLIDKFSRKTIAIKMDNKNSDEVLKVLKRLVRKYRMKSITFDNDTSFAKHRQLGMPTFFCHTYSSREKWQVELCNRLYRLFFPKWSELQLVNQEKVDEATEYHNNYPMKCLGYLTPNEVFERENKKTPINGCHAEQNLRNSDKESEANFANKVVV